MGFNIIARGWDAWAIAANAGIAPPVGTYWKQYEDKYIANYGGTNQYLFCYGKVNNQFANSYELRNYQNNTNRIYVEVCNGWFGQSMRVSINDTKISDLTGFNSGNARSEYRGSSETNATTIFNYTDLFIIEYSGTLNFKFENVSSSTGNFIAAWPLPNTAMIYTNNGGVILKSKNISINDNGILKQGKSVFVNLNGIIKGGN